ncbi:1280_t:CDS:2 [Acaulospora morrowiae]|uniref:Histone H1 n=1 Tax=Acaulospora morrowiae TaxID=94023 RepID=A0A9N9DAF5_9GLOM|nr:1280_t:CDS:2 [Acaulospora morrowiae]
MSKTQAKTPSHPRYEDMITEAIMNLKERKGSSRQAIKKYIVNNYNLPDNGRTNFGLRNAISKGVENGVFTYPNDSKASVKLTKKEPAKKEKDADKKVVDKKVTDKKVKTKAEKKDAKSAVKDEKKEVKPNAEKNTRAKKNVPPAKTTKPAVKKSVATSKKTRLTKSAEKNTTGLRRSPRHTK